MKLVYRIEDVQDRNGNKKEIPLEWLEHNYYIYFAKIGRGARLMFEEMNGEGLHTSAVEDISIWENRITITTMNTVYYLTPSIVEE